LLGKARERTERIIGHAPPDGAWSEGVQYWEYGTSYFLRWLEALKSSGAANASSPAPYVEYPAGRLSIRHGGRSWDVAMDSRGLAVAGPRP
jgi:hypothetical protein